MSSHSPCTALNNAIRNKGVSHSQLARSVGTSEDRVREIVTGRERATQQEFNSLARALGIQSSPPADAAHTTR